MNDVRTLAESSDPGFRTMIADMKKLLDSGEPAGEELPERIKVKRVYLRDPHTGRFTSSPKLAA